jgi:hypothetical protein
MKNTDTLWIRRMLALDTDTIPILTIIFIIIFSQIIIGVE